MLRHALDLAVRQQRAGVREAEDRSDAHHVPGQLVEPASQRGVGAVAACGGDRALDQLGRAAVVPGGQGVLDGVGPQAVCLVPVARTPVQARYQLWLFVEQPRAKNVSEQVVVPVPPAVVVEWDQEEVGPVEPLQGGAAAGRPVTASHRAPVSRLSREVCRRKRATWSG